MLRCFEQEVCNISFLHPIQKIKFKVWFLKTDPPMWMVVDFEFMNVLVESNNNNFMDRLFVNKPVAIVYNIV